MATDTKTRKCTYRRCDGGTVRLVSGMDVECQRCGGTGRIPSVTDCRAIDAAMTRRYALLKVMRERAQERDGRRNGDIQYDADSGRSLLEEREPERHARMLDALEAGRVDAVIDCLAAYFHANN